MGKLGLTLLFLFCGLLGSVIGSNEEYLDLKAVDGQGHENIGSRQVRQFGFGGPGFGGPGFGGRGFGGGPGFGGRGFGGGFGGQRQRFRYVERSRSRQRFGGGRFFG